MALSNVVAFAAAFDPFMVMLYWQRLDHSNSPRVSMGVETPLNASFARQGTLERDLLDCFPLDLIDYHEETHPIAIIVIGDSNHFDT